MKKSFSECEKQFSLLRRLNKIKIKIQCQVDPCPKSARLNFAIYRYRVPVPVPYLKKYFYPFFSSLLLEYKKETIYYDMMYDCRRCMKTSVNRLETLTETLGKKLCFIFILHFERFSYFLYYFVTLLLTSIPYRKFC